MKPATLWRAFFVLFGVLTAARAGVAPNRPPDLAQVDRPTDAQVAQLVEQVREAGIAGQFYLQFELRTLPRRGPEKTFAGQLWGGRNEQGTILRVELVDRTGAAHRFLLQNGAQARVWRLEGGRAVQLGGADLFAPLIPEVEVSAFDLQMPFLYWPGATAERLARVFGRPANAVLFRPPPAFAAEHPQIGGVRVYLDTQHNAITQTEVLGANARVVKTFSLVSLKRVEQQYLPKQADYRNEATRDKTRLQVGAAALNLRLPAAVFDPARLGEPAPPPAAEKIVRIP